MMTTRERCLKASSGHDGPVCPHCGVVNHAYADRRAVLYRCAEKWCRKEFTVTMRTVMERSKIALHKWLRPLSVSSSKRGVSPSAPRTLDIGYEAAWFMDYRIREAMRDGGLTPVRAVARSSAAERESEVDVEVLD